MWQSKFGVRHLFFHVFFYLRCSKIGPTNSFCCDDKLKSLKGKLSPIILIDLTLAIHLLLKGQRSKGKHFIIALHCFVLHSKQYSAIHRTRQLLTVCVKHNINKPRTRDKRQMGPVSK